MTDFEKIYTEHFTDVYRYVLSLCRDEAIAEEVTQETFFKALKSINSFHGTCKLYVWLCQIAKNTYFSLCKKNKRMRADIDEMQPDINIDLVGDLSDSESAKRLHRLLHNLKEPYKEVFTLRVFGELPFVQIGELFNKTDSWARVIFYRAKKQLQEAAK